MRQQHWTVQNFCSILVKLSTHTHTLICMYMPQRHIFKTTTAIKLNCLFYMSAYVTV